MEERKKTLNLFRFYDAKFRSQVITDASPPAADALEEDLMVLIRHPGSISHAQQAAYHIRYPSRSADVPAYQMSR